MNDLILRNIGELVTCSGPDWEIIEDAAVIVEQGTITEILKSDKLDKRATNKFDVIDARNKPVLPGFTDPHTHFVFGGYRAEEFNRRLQGTSYSEIMAQGGGILNTVKATRDESFTELKDKAINRLDSFLWQGVTTVEGKSGYGLDVTTELKQIRVMERSAREHPVDIAITFLGAHALPAEYENDRKGYLELLLNEALPRVSEREKVEFCDVFCDEGAFTVEEAEKILSQARDLGLKLKIHSDEFSSIGGTELVTKLKATSADHLLKVTDDGIEQLANSSVVPVLLPLTAFSLNEEYAPARNLIDKGLPLALATDFNPGSCYSESIPLIIALSTIYMGLTVEETIRGLTINAAKALGREDSIGSIEPGKQGDLITLDLPSYRHLAYHFGVNHAEMVIKKGKLVVDNRTKGSLH